MNEPTCGRRALIRDLVVHVTYSRYSPIMRRALLKACRRLRARPDLLKIDKTVSGLGVGVWYNTIGGLHGELTVLFDNGSNGSYVIEDAWLSQFMEEDDTWFSVWNGE